MKEFPDLMTCDVVNKEQLALYRKCVRDWTEMLLGDDVNSIKNQLNDFVIRFAMYKTYGKAIELTYTKADFPNGLTHYLFSMFQNAFLESHIMSIRRFIDDNYSDPSKKVFSLVRLCDEIVENSHLLTRENYICFDGLLFDQEPDTLDSWRRNHDRNYRNALFSSLCKSPTGKRDDIVDVAIVKNLKKQIVGLVKIKTFANKFYAHAADPKTRKNEDSYSTITLEEIEKSQKVIFNVVHGLGKFVGDISLTELPAVLFDLFENWDKPVLDISHLEEVRKYWRELADEQETEARQFRDVSFKNWERDSEV